MKHQASEIDHLNDLNAQLMVKVEKLMRTEERLRNKISSLEDEGLKQKDSNKDLTQDLEKLRERMSDKGKLEKYNEVLRDKIESLRSEFEDMQHQLQTADEDKEEMEQRYQDLSEALNDEREAKAILEDRLRDLSTNQSLAPSQLVTDSISLRKDLSTSSESSKEMSVGDSPKYQSSRPQQQNAVSHSLFDELNSSTSSDEAKELVTLRADLKSYKLKLEKMEAEKATLEKKLSEVREVATARKEGDTNSEISGLLRQVRDLQEQVATKEQMVEQMRSKVEDTSMKNAQLESEIDKLKSSLDEALKLRTAEVGEKKEEVANKEKEMVVLHERLQGLQHKLTEEEDVSRALEVVILNTEKVTRGVVSELKKFLKSIKNAQLSKMKDLSNERISSPDISYLSEEPTGKLPLENIGSQVDVQVEKRCLLSILSARELAFTLKEPLETFKKAILESSLSASKSSLHQEEKDQGELELAKVNAKLKAKVEEIENLKIILRARTATQDVVISQLKSKLESESKANQSEQFRLRYEIRQQLAALRDREYTIMTFQDSLKEYSAKLQVSRKEFHKMRDDKEELEMYLNATIRKKIELQEKLEEYEIERERLISIPKNITSSRV